jgi:hypothetical protein
LSLARALHVKAFPGCFVLERVHLEINPS